MVVFLLHQNSPEGEREYTTMFGREYEWICGQHGPPITRPKMRMPGLSWSMSNCLTTISQAVHGLEIERHISQGYRSQKTYPVLR